MIIGELDMAHTATLSIEERLSVPPSEFCERYDGTVESILGPSSKAETTLTHLRWCGLKGLVTELAKQFNVDARLEKVHKGFIRVTTRISAVGCRDRVNGFFGGLDASVDAYNKIRFLRKPPKGEVVK